MTLIIDGVDFSDFIQQKTDIVERPRYIDGKGIGTAINGNAIFDRIATKYDVSFLLKPMPAENIREIIRACEANESEVQYTSVLFDTERSIKAQLSISAVRYLTESNGNRIYGECSIVVSEK